jgi:hypothetical protein
VTTMSGRFLVERWGDRWTVTDLAEHQRLGPIFATEEQAQQHAHRRNQPPQPAPAKQPDLFSQEAGAAGATSGAELDHETGRRGAPTPAPALTHHSIVTREKG